MPLLYSSLRLRLRAGLLLTASAWALAARPAAAQAPVFDQATVDADLAVKRLAIRSLDTAVDGQGNTLYAGGFDGSLSFGPTVLNASPSRSLFVAKRATSGSWLWAVMVPSRNAQVGGVDVDAAGDLYITGSFEDASITFGSTTLTNSRPGGLQSDVFVAKISGATGAWQWAVGAGGYTSNSGTDLAVDLALDGQGGAYVTGFYNSQVATFGPYAVTNNRAGSNDVFVASLSTATGAWRWVRSGGSTAGADDVYSLDVDGQGNAYLVGSFFGVATYGPFTVNTPNVSALLVSKLDRAGTWQWLTTAAGDNTSSNSVYAQHLAVDAAGRRGYVAGGFVSRTAQFGATQLTNAGGQQPGRNLYYSDVFVAQLNLATGSWSWAVRAGGLGSDYLSTPVLDGQGHVYVGGAFAARPLGSIIFTEADFGSTLLSSAGGDDGVVARLDTAGTWQWALRAGGGDNDALSPVGFDGQGRLLLNGFFYGPSTTVGAITLTTAGGTAGTPFQARLLPGSALPVRAERSATRFDLYPNPAVGFVMLAGLPAGQPVEILDALGRKAATGVVAAGEPLRLRLAPGAYVVRAGGAVQHLLVQ
ncbi:T9SS type A sorting domain-containing protein [Hymenobacter sp. 15J16-1T3B]|uniref:T9SS type A sorting domain-containing protein n=1 Tax=Hymenobacter sp. 15J16-1T3B TaxID=2886941 RepID=UPI001D0FAE8C|nr:T9SS type A sorting domain-containing protein [Hymenobacter sp. 15J16-1T3B]MCC3156144.1 T9SS type A sorting domain-containing protein [Hymenobacter sp. 15J16-1T3B]